ncbi:DUF374 domain-containing protein [bacterium]|nr:DUF374 domain-containing protein [bacterium]
MRSSIIAFIVGMIFRVFRWTWRIDEGALPLEAQSRLDGGGTVVFAHWHGDEWPLLATFAYRKMGVLVSDSEDGKIMAKFTQSLGFSVSRGSSTRGGAKGFLGMIKNMRRDKLPMVSLAVDGPKGPRHEPKKGILALAKLLRAGVVVACVGCDRKWVFEKSWSQAYLPKFFAKIRVEYRYVDLVDEDLKKEEIGLVKVKTSFEALASEMSSIASS